MRLWDIRGDQEVCQYKPPTPNSSFTSVGVSMSGRLVLASSDDSTIHMWDITGTHLGQLAGHDNRQTVQHVRDNSFFHIFNICFTFFAVVAGIAVSLPWLGPINTSKR